MNGIQKSCYGLCLYKEVIISPFIIRFILLVTFIFMGGLFSTAEGPKRMAVLISVDGLASYYLNDPMADISTLRRMASEGATAERMNVCFPSVTWTSHTTLVTGVYPRKHGVIDNSIFNRKTLKSVSYVGDSVYTKDEAVKAQTLYDAAHEAGLKTAAVIWPCVRDAKTLDWLTPDVGTEELILQGTTPELNRSLGEPIGNPIAAFSKWRWGTAPGPLRDGKYSELAAYLLTEKKPDLLLMHLVCPDSYQHEFGPQTPEAYWSLNYVDYRINFIIEKVKQSGLLDRTVFFIVGDHGFESVTHDLYPNVLLQKEGLLKMDGSTVTPESEAYVSCHGGSAGVYILNPQKKSEIALRIKQLFSKREGIQQILEPVEFHRLGLPTPDENPEQSDLILIPEEHYSFSGKVSGEDWTLSGALGGDHGYLPTHPRMGAGFIAWGSGIQSGVKLETINEVDVTPTLAELLSIKMKETDGRVLRELLK